MSAALTADGHVRPTCRPSCASRRSRLQAVRCLSPTIPTGKSSRRIYHQRTTQRLPRWSVSPRGGSSQDTASVSASLCSARSEATRFSFRCRAPLRCSATGTSFGSPSATLVANYIQRMEPRGCGWSYRSAQGVMAIHPGTRARSSAIPSAR